MVTMATPRLSRLGRGAAAAAFATYTALFFHVSSGGAVPAFLGVVAPLVLSVAVCTLLAGRKLTVLRLSASVAASQFLFHSLFSFGGDLAGATSHAHHEAAAADLSPLVSDAHSHDPTMWFGHVAAAVVTIGVFLLADRVLRGVAALRTRFVSWVRRVFVVTDALVDISPSRFVPSGWTAVGFPPRFAVASAASRRGPPLLTV